MPSLVETSPILALDKVGPSLAGKFTRLHVCTVRDLLFHLPLRYQDRSRITPIRSLEVGCEARVIGQIVEVTAATKSNRSMLIRVRDDSGHFTVRLIHASNYHQRVLVEGAWLDCYAEVRFGKTSLEMIHPEFTLHKNRPTTPEIRTLTPIYASTDGVSQRMWRTLISQALTRLAPEAFSGLPPLSSIPVAHTPTQSVLRFLHQPVVGSAELDGKLRSYRQRMAFEELLGHILAMRLQRQAYDQYLAPAMAKSSSRWSDLLQGLGFRLTNAQNRVIKKINDDLASSRPAQRLIQGDVGSGKTIVAASAILTAVDNGFQAVIMAPTELLCEQHFQTFQAWLVPLDIRLNWLSSKASLEHRAKVLDTMADGSCDLVIGTHAIFQEGIKFAKLGLIVIDEQHRFGVDQRLALREKGYRGDVVPHQISMTATPIPRTLSMVVYADMDCSQIDEMPPGRVPVTTVVTSNDKRDLVVEKVAGVCKGGRQAYWVCPLIDEGESDTVMNATEIWKRVQLSFPGLRIGLVHGKMPSRTREEIMVAFHQHDLDILVATTVIETGVDVTNASIMIVENAERFGLAQLHQLRGRVGRGVKQSYCVLLYQPPLSESGYKRLEILRDSNDGFKIAEIDLKQRGAGEILGTRQTGLHQLRIADLARDGNLIEAVSTTADVLARDHPDALEILRTRWIQEDRPLANV